MRFFRKKISKLIQEQAFFPSLPGIFLNPFYFARKSLVENIQELSPELTGDLLDIGCGTKPYKDLFPCNSYIGLEYDTPQNRKKNTADFFYTGTTFPLESQKFDTVIATQVLEHVFYPDEFMKEINRVMKPSATLLLTVPFIWDEHEQPFDYARYTSFGIKNRLERHHLKVISAKKACTDCSLFFQLINAYLYKKIHFKSFIFTFLLRTLLTAPMNILGILAKWILPKNEDMFLNNVILAKKIE